MLQINLQEFDIEERRVEQNQIKKQQQGMTYLGLARLSSNFVKDFLNQDHAGPYKKQLFIKSLGINGIVIRILPENSFGQNMIQNYSKLTILKCSMKDFHQFFIPFLQNIQSWNIQNLTLGVGGLRQESWSQQVKMLKSDPVFQKFNHICNRIIPKINFKNLQQLVLQKLEISNIQFLTFISAPLLRKVFLKQNHIVSTKSLTKFKRTGFTLQQQQINFIQLAQNPINQFNNLNRISFLDQQGIHIMLKIGKYNNFYTYKTDLRFIIKSQIRLLRKQSINRTKWAHDQKYDKEAIRVSQRFNKLMKNN